MFFVVLLIHILILHVLSKVLSWLLLEKLNPFVEKNKQGFLFLLPRGIYQTFAACSWQRALDHALATFDKPQLDKKEKTLLLCLSVLGLWFSFLVSALVVYLNSQFIFANSQSVMQLFMQSNIALNLVSSDFSNFFIFLCLSIIISMLLRIEFIFTVLVFTLLLLGQISFVVSLAFLLGEVIGQSLGQWYKRRHLAEAKIYFPLLIGTTILGLGLAIYLRQALAVPYAFGAEGSANAQNLLFLVIMGLVPPFIVTMAWGHFYSNKPS